MCPSEKWRTKYVVFVAVLPSLIQVSHIHSCTCLLRFFAIAKARVYLNKYSSKVVESVVTWSAREKVWQWQWRWSPSVSNQNSTKFLGTPATKNVPSHPFWNLMNHAERIRLHPILRWQRYELMISKNIVGGRYFPALHVSVSLHPWWHSTTADVFGRWRKIKN